MNSLGNCRALHGNNIKMPAIINQIQYNQVKMPNICWAHVFKPELTNFLTVLKQQKQHCHLLCHYDDLLTSSCLLHISFNSDFLRANS